MKQSKLRRRRVLRYAILYFVLLVVFVALIAGPIVAGKYIPDSTFAGIKKSLGDTMILFQPVGLNNNDTRDRNHTGTAAATTAASTGDVAKMLLL